MEAPAQFCKKKKNGIKPLVLSAYWIIMVILRS